MTEKAGLLAYDSNPTPQSLKNRHPYVETVRETDVSMAYGDQEIPHLLDLLGDDRHVLKGLQALSDRMSHQEQKAQAIANNGAQIITRLLSHAELNVQLIATEVAAQLSLLPQGREAIEAAGAIETCGNLLNGGMLLEARVAHVLNVYASFAESCDVINRSALPALSKSLLSAKAEQGRWKIEVCETLTKVVMATRCDRLIGIGLVAHCVELIGASTDTPLNAALLHLLRAIGTYHAKGREEILEHCSALFSVLNSPSAKCRESTTALLAVLLLELPAKKIMEPIAVRLWQLYTGDDETNFCKQMALQAIRTAQEWEPFRNHFVRAVLSDDEKTFRALEEIFGIHLMRIAYTLARDPSSDSNLLTIALNLLIYLASKEPTKGDILSETPSSTKVYIEESLPDFVAFLNQLDHPHAKKLLLQTALN